MNVEQTLGLEHKIELFRLRGEKEAQFRTIEDLRTRDLELKQIPGSRAKFCRVASKSRNQNRS